MTKFKEISKLAEQLQTLAHDYGYETFRDAIAEACYRASEDTEDFENKLLTQKYRYLANCVKDAENNEPVFSSKYIEE